MRENGTYVIINNNHGLTQRGLPYIPFTSFGRFMHLFGRESYKPHPPTPYTSWEIFCCWFSHRCLQQLQVGQDEVRSQHIIPVTHVNDRDPSTSSRSQQEARVGVEQLRHKLHPEHGKLERILQPAVIYHFTNYFAGAKKMPKGADDLDWNRNVQVYL